jgi:lysophospholipase L1-like esterase
MELPVGGAQGGRGIPANGRTRDPFERAAARMAPSDCIVPAKPFTRLAKDKRVFHVPDIMKGVALRPVYVSDALHPNDAGYARIAERLEAELRPLLPELNSRR